MNAPVLLFVYNRPDHLRRTLNALLANHGFDETTVFVHSDAPKTPNDEQRVDEVRRLVRGASRTNLTLIESDENKGSARSIREGVSELLTDSDRAVVLEDDLVTSRYFLDYMNAALERYAASERVLQVCGFGVRLGRTQLPETFFVPLSSSWGWGTWSRAWDKFNRFNFDTGLLRLRQNGHLRHSFDLNGRYPMYYTLRRSLRNDLATWDIRWQLYLFLTQGLALWPARSLVENIGADGSGVHSARSKRDATAMVSDLADSPVTSFPVVPEAHPEAWSAVQRAIVANNPFWHRWLVWWTRLFP